ncbi:MAG: bifunctional phosphoribosylaminoimidazolecarboxamide formyltransferase/IMP cyclohydrolase [Tenacibaculum sp.]
MSNTKTIKSALISVFNKKGLEPVVKKLNALNISIYSTGGTEKFIKDLGISVIPIEQISSYPAILGGRVKTIHPKIFGGILNRQNHESDVAEMATYQIPQIDLVIVDLYPFEQTVASGALEQAIVEKIDIGGISLIRAAAKNFKDTFVVSSTEQYSKFLSIINSTNGSTTLAQRRDFAVKAFNISSHYDTAIFNYFNQDEAILKISENTAKTLRYGENPHQKGYFFGNLDDVFYQLQGKDLSYNNLLDVDAAINLMNEFAEKSPTFAILKHNNACGLAQRKTLQQAYADALIADSVSAFGGVLIANTTVNKATAHKINMLFFELIIAPSYDAEALELLKTKKNRIILVQKQISLANRTVKTALNGFLVQDKDCKTDKLENFNYLSNKLPSEKEQQDLLFASKISKHTKSNTIVLVKNKQLLASGTGQTSRVDALKQAIEKAKRFNFNLSGAAMASDAFFPFPDCVEIAHKAGIKSIIQPGGSINDQLSIDYCNQNNIAMIFTGIRHFKH